MTIKMKKFVFHFVLRSICTTFAARKKTTLMNEKKQKVALITGITGQDGSYLAEFLLQKGYHIGRYGHKNSRGIHNHCECPVT